MAWVLVLLILGAVVLAVSGNPTYGGPTKSGGVNLNPRTPRPSTPPIPLPVGRPRCHCRHEDHR